MERQLQSRGQHVGHFSSVGSSDSSSFDRHISSHTHSIVLSLLVCIGLLPNSTSKSKSILDAGAFFNGVFLLALALSILLQSIERFVHLETVDHPILILIVGCVGLGLNVLSALVIHGKQLSSVTR